MAQAQLKYAEPVVSTLSDKDFHRLAAVINDYSGIKMPPSKKTMLEGRLRRRLRATGLETLDDYCSYLFDNDGLADEIVGLIDVVTTNKTDFFREPRHFEFLREKALPSIVRSGNTSIRAWSAACSTGAEPYSIAMTLEAFAEAWGGPLAYFILATDLSTEVLSVAQRGVYPRSALAPVPEPWRSRYVNTSRLQGSSDVRIAPRLRSNVGFARLNFMDTSYPVGAPMDLIFCRNVLIYFEKTVQAKVLERLCDCLAPGGFLFIGHSESISGFRLPVRTVSNTVFQKV